MSIVKKPYKLSVWEQQWDTEREKFIEVQIGVFGSDQMKYQGRALKPTFLRKINGEKKLTFEMYKKFTDNVTGELVDNPFVDWLINERKVKLEYEDKEHTFIIKNVTENSSNYLCTYSLVDACVNELSKNGFGVTLNTELNNNQGDIETLAERILEGTDWNVEADFLVQTLEEPLVYVNIENEIGVVLLKEEEDGRISESSARLSGPVLAFYSSCTGKPERFQFIFLKDYAKDKVTLEENRIIHNNNCQYYYEPEDYQSKENKYGFYLPDGFQLLDKGESGVDNDSDSTISTWYRGNRYVFSQKAEYLPQLGMYVNVYTGEEYTYENNKTDNEYYGFVESNYTSPTLVNNIITNPDMTNGTSGWYIGRKSLSTLEVEKEAVYGAFVGSTFKNCLDLFGTSNQGLCKPYLKVTLKVGDILFNSGPTYSRSSIGNMPKNDVWLYNYKIIDSAGKEWSEMDWENVNRPFDIELGEYETVSYTSDTNRFEAEHSITEKEKYPAFRIIKNSYTEETFKTNSKLRFALVARTAGTYYIEAASLYRMVKITDENGNGAIITPNSDDSYQVGDIEHKHYYFKKYPEDSIKSKDTLEFVTNDSDMKPMYNIGAKKIRSINVKESNYFNNLQTLAETFGAWLDLDVKTNDDGTLDKTVKFKKYVGQDNYVGFKYGVNLKEVQRTNESSQIVNKLIVKPNNNELAKNGVCTIQRAAENVTGEDYIYDFQYYFNKGLIDARDFLETNYCLEGAKEDFNKIEKFGNCEITSSVEGQDIWWEATCEYEGDGSFVIIIRLPESGKFNEAEWPMVLTLHDVQLTDGNKVEKEEFNFVINPPVGENSVSVRYNINDSIQFNLKGYYPRLKRINNKMLDISNREFGLRQDYNKISAEYTVNETGVRAAEEKMEEINAQFLEQVGFNIAQTDAGKIVTAYEGEKATLFDPPFGSEYWDVGVDAKGGDFAISIELKTTGIPFDQETPIRGYLELEECNLLNGAHEENRRYYIEGIIPAGNNKTTILYSIPYQTAKTYTKTESTNKLVTEYVEYSNKYDIYNKEFYSLSVKKTQLEEELKSLKEEYDALKNHKTALNKLFYEKYHSFIQEGTWVNEEYVDDEKYYADALSVLYNSCYPKVTYNITPVVGASVHGEFGKYLDAQVGDKTYVEDGEFFGYDENGNPIRVEIVVTEKSEQLDRPDKTSIKVQNFKNEFQDLFQKITATVQQTQYSTGAYQKAVALAEANAQKKGEFLAEALSDADAMFSAAGQQSVVQSVDGITITDLNTPCNQIKMIGGAVILSKDDGNGNQKWTTAMTGDGISASVITSGVVNTGEVAIMNGNDAAFRWNDKGINAFCDKKDGAIDTSKFVRMDKYGIYGMENKDGTSWAPGSVEDIDDEANFSLTWQGLKVANKYEEKDTDTGDTTTTEVTARIGKNAGDTTTGNIISVTKKTQEDNEETVTEILKINNNGDAIFKGHIEATSGRFSGQLSAPYFDMENRDTGEKGSITNAKQIIAEEGIFNNLTVQGNSDYSSIQTNNLKIEDVELKQIGIKEEKEFVAQVKSVEASFNLDSTTVTPAGATKYNYSIYLTATTDKKATTEVGGTQENIDVTVSIKLKNLSSPVLKEWVIPLARNSTTHRRTETYIVSLTEIESVSIIEHDKEVKWTKNVLSDRPVLSITGDFVPSVNGADEATGSGEGRVNEGSGFDLGAFDNRWRDIYTDGIVQTSDEKEKNSIEDLPEKYSIFFDNLTPVIYKMNNGTSDRYHVGLGARATEQALLDSGMTTQEFAGIVISDYKEGENHEDSRYGIRYGELHGLEIYEIQKLKKYTIELESKIERLEALIENLINNK